MFETDVCCGVVDDGSGEISNAASTWVMVDDLTHVRRCTKGELLRDDGEVAQAGVVSQNIKSGDATEVLLASLPHCQREQGVSGLQTGSANLGGLESFGDPLTFLSTKHHHQKKNSSAYRFQTCPQHNHD